MQFRDLMFHKLAQYIFIDEILWKVQVDKYNPTDMNKIVAAKALNAPAILPS